VLPRLPFSATSTAAAPAHELGVLLPGLDPRHAREIHRHHGGDVGQAEPVGGEVLAPGQSFVQRLEELLHPHHPALRELGNLRVVHRAGQRPVGHGGRAVAQRLRNGHQPFEFHAPVPAGDFGLLLRRDAHQRRLRVAGLQVGRNAGVVGQQRSFFGAQRGHRALRIDLAVGRAQLLTTGEVDLHGVVRNALFGKQDARAPRTRRGSAVVENDHRLSNSSVPWELIA
jgi:hypothetical protein